MTDAEINEAAAMAMGWTEIHVEARGSNEGTCYSLVVGRRAGGVHNADEIPVPATSIEDAVAFAAAVNVCWRLQSPIGDGDSYFVASVWLVGRGDEIESASSPARALALAVLKVLEVSDD